MFSQQSSLSSSSSMSSSVSSDAVSHNRRRPKHISKPAPGSLSGEWYSCSQSSILTAMDRFVKAVNNMDATVLVPSKLRDMNFSAQAPITVRSASGDLHSFYELLNSVKNELLWGGHSVDTPSSHLLLQRSTSSSASTTSSQLKTTDVHELSLCTPPASTSSDSESDADSMLNDERMQFDSEDDSPTATQSHLSLAFRHHLQGLNSILHQLSDSAEYLSSRYLQEVDDS